MLQRGRAASKIATVQRLTGKITRDMRGRNEQIIYNGGYFRLSIRVFWAPVWYERGYWKSIAGKISVLRKGYLRSKAIRQGAIRGV